MCFLAEMTFNNSHLDMIKCPYHHQNFSWRAIGERARGRHGDLVAPTLLWRRSCFSLSSSSIRSANNRYWLIIPRRRLNTYTVRPSVGLFRLLVRLSGTCYMTSSEIRHVALAVQPVFEDNLFSFTIM